MLFRQHFFDDFDEMRDVFKGSFGGKGFCQTLDESSWRMMFFEISMFAFCCNTSIWDLAIKSHLFACRNYIVTLLIDLLSEFPCFLFSEWISHALVPLRSHIVKGTPREPILSFFIIAKKNLSSFLRRFAAWEFKAQQCSVVPLLRMKDWYMIDDLRQMHLMLNMFFCVYTYIFRYWCLFGNTQKGIGC